MPHEPYQYEGEDCPLWKGLLYWVGFAVAFYVLSGIVWLVLAFLRA